MSKIPETADLEALEAELDAIEDFQREYRLTPTVSEGKLENCSITRKGRSINIQFSDARKEHLPKPDPELAKINAQVVKKNQQKKVEKAEQLRRFEQNHANITNFIEQMKTNLHNIMQQISFIGFAPTTADFKRYYTIIDEFIAGIQDEITHLKSLFEKIVNPIKTTTNKTLLEAIEIYMNIYIENFARMKTWLLQAKASIFLSGNPHIRADLYDPQAPRLTLAQIKAAIESDQLWLQNTFTELQKGLNIIKIGEISGLKRYAARIRIEQPYESPTQITIEGASLPSEIIAFIRHEIEGAIK